MVWPGTVKRGRSLMRRVSPRMPVKNQMPAPIRPATRMSTPIQTPAVDGCSDRGGVSGPPGKVPPHEGSDAVVTDPL